MKKKNKIYALVAVLAATLTMLFANPTEAKAAELPSRLVTEVCLGYNCYEEPEETKVYYLKNSHGDIIGLVDESGNLLVSYSYNSFGELVTAVTFTPETINNRFLYAGEQYDAASDLYYLRARNYDAGAGRFTQEDTYLGDGRNLYAYTHSNPLKYIDPSGHASYTCVDDESDLLDDRLNDVAGGSGANSGNSNPVTVYYNGVQSPVYRGGNSFNARNCDIKIDSSTGNLTTDAGVSVNTSAAAVSKYGGAYRIETMPSGLNIIQTGRSGHYEIVPASPMSRDVYQSYLDEITVSGPY